MALTRAAAEASAVRAVGVKLLTDAGMATTTTGASAPNVDLNDPLLRTLDHLGLSAADPTNISDADLAQVQSKLLVRFLDYLTIQVAQAALIHLGSLEGRQQWEDYLVDHQYVVQRFTELLTTLWANYRKLYLYSGAPAVGQQCPAVQHPLITDPYFPPFLPGPQNPPWPFGPQF